MSDEYHGSPRFGGDMDRNEVEIDLNKFMALLQEKSELKDRIRELEDEKNDNPYQKFIFVAGALQISFVLHNLLVYGFTRTFV